MLRTLSTHMERYQHRGVSPFDAVDVVGADFVGELIRLGLANELMKQAWDLHLAEPRANGNGKHIAVKAAKAREYEGAGLSPARVFVFVSGIASGLARTARLSLFAQIDKRLRPIGRFLLLRHRRGGTITSARSSR